MAEDQKDRKITRTGEGIPVGTSPEEERLRELHRNHDLPKAAQRRGIPGEGRDDAE